ncbi:hypothetical protein N9N32_00390 [Alphaproteobacteria bacterium]|nr:hypothetical protein [Alphaproteobacteria bacterium]
MPGIAAIVVSSVMSLLAYVVGEEAWNNYTYEDRVTACIEQVELALPSASKQILKDAEINCRKALR